MTTSSAQPTVFTGTYTYTIGRRKTSVACVRVYAGSGTVIVNGKQLKEYIRDKFDLDTILAPLTIIDWKNKVDVSVVVSGGGMKSQAEAIRHGISKGIIEMDLMLRPTLKKQGFLTRDPRMKERKKPGLKGARRSPQWAKR